MKLYPSIGYTSNLSINLTHVADVVYTHQNIVEVTSILYIKYEKLASSKLKFFTPFITELFVVCSQIFFVSHP